MPIRLTSIADARTRARLATAFTCIESHKNKSKLNYTIFMADV